MKNGLITLIILVLLSVEVYGQKSGASQSAAQANNPLANMTAINFHNYYIPRLTDAPKDAYLNNSWVRFAKPIAEGKWLLRVSAPLNTTGIPDPVDGSVNSINGLGDVNAFMSYNFVSKPTATVGIGPNITAPTATETALGTGKWQGGFAMVAFIAKSAVFQFGGLVTWQASFAGDSNRPGTNVAAIQPFYFWQLGKGAYIRGAPIWAFDFKNDAFSVPLGLGVGKVVKVENTVFNLFIEPQYSMIHAGTQPQFQLFTGINLQFMGN
ncbi:hypothetical protein [Echinicola rosea]|uniref:Neuromedin U n=1 Tax=Echinicola rosea TaxID=1807691 RepID=A0ABQ1VAH8_9BACT|nr:hypothetical protein [Echinicola rosea]GGF47095.1 hypothetical protein GCM10011339_39520 [Echinicola rosea]